MINNTSKNNGENIKNGWLDVATAKDNFTRRLTCPERYFNDKFSYELGGYKKTYADYRAIVSFFIVTRFNN